MASGANGVLFEDLLDGTLTAQDFEDESNIKGALYDSTGTAAWDFTAGIAYTASNEISGTGYTAKGDTLTTTEVTIATGSLKYDADDAQWTTATLTGVRGILVYDDSITTPQADAGLVGVDFGSDQSVTAGTFTVQWAAGGIMTLDYTP
tara:strand:+ start:670 stop:1116 length:447 start_codon:yes stop_codon:yes gene_type:complete